MEKRGKKNKKKLMVVTNRKACQDGLLKRLEEVFDAYVEGKGPRGGSLPKITW